MVTNIFMTGGAGFLGRAILGRYARERPDVLFTVFSRDEAKQDRTRRLFPQHRYLLGDIRDARSLDLAMMGHQVVIHAAAMKYVPQGEINVTESVAINVDGSRNVCVAAMRAGVERVVGISTDKACRPVNVYGLTKLLMERLFQESDGRTDTRFNLVRYGNVISSTGSVIPLFRRQAREGRVTLTNPEMTRFWLDINEAVDLVEMALAEAEGGTVLIPRLSSLSMREVAEVSAAIELGDQGAENVQYDVIGQRFGEKVHEELVSPIETVYTTLTEALMGDRPHRHVIMRMWPVTDGVRADAYGIPYSSDWPDDRMPIEDFKRMVLEAPE